MKGDALVQEIRAISRTILSVVKRLGISEILLKPGDPLAFILPRTT